MLQEDAREILRQRIVQILGDQPGLKARQIAIALDVERTQVNSVLYGELESLFGHDSDNRWWLKSSSVDKVRTNQNTLRAADSVEMRPQIIAQQLFELLGINNGPITFEKTDDGVYEKTPDAVVDASPEEESIAPEVVFASRKTEDISVTLDFDYDVPDTYSERQFVSIELPEYSLMNHLPSYPTADEEQKLWRRYLKLRRLQEIVGSGTNSEGKFEPRFILLTIAEDLSRSTALIRQLKKVSCLDIIGDKLILTAGNPTRSSILANMVLSSMIQNSETKRTKVVAPKNDNCSLEDLLSPVFREMASNIAFGKGNSDLLDRIASEMNCDQLDIRQRTTRLAIDIQLLPPDIMRLTDPNTPVSGLLQTIEKTIPAQPATNILKDYVTFVNDIIIDGKMAFDRIVVTHLRLAAKGAQTFDKRNTPLTVDDLFQEGCLGVIKAAEHFSPAHGTRFMSYGLTWVHQTITRALANDSRTIRIPVHMIETIDKLMSFRNVLAQELEREPTPEEIASEMKMMPDKVKEILEISQSSIALESPIKYRNDRLVDAIKDHAVISPEDAAVEQLLKDDVETLLSQLSPRQKHVIKLRFGLDDGQSHTLEEVGQQLKPPVTRERIRQIEAKALRRLRHPSRSKRLKEYI